MIIPLLQEIVIIFGLSIIVLLICHRFHIPNIVGFLFTGVLCGPHGLGLVKGIENVETLANIGIVLLLFTIGMEFSLKKLLNYKRFFIVGGLLQVFLTTLAGFAIAQYLERPVGESIFLGFLLSLSSTAIVLRMFDMTYQTETPSGKIVTGILIFQDIIAVPMMLLIPFLAGFQGQFNLSFLILLGESLLILTGAFFCAVLIVPWLLYHIAKTRSRELFLLTVLTVCFSVAWLTSSIGLSLSLGAFLAGLIIADSEYRNEAVGDILPFQDIFTSFFFVSIGMLLDVQYVIEQPFFIFSVTIGVLFLKALIATLTTLFLGMPLRTAILSGIALSQVGEFSFVLAKSGVSFSLGTEFHYQLFLASALLTMAITPTLITIAPQIANFFLRLPFPSSLKTGMDVMESANNVKKIDHVVIVGYGVCGRNVALSCHEMKIPYVILEMNPETVKQEKIKGEPIYFGDATHESIMHHAGVDKAKAIAVLVNDPIASLRVVEHARRLNPHIYVIVRTKYIQEMKPMYQLGADDVIPDEFGSSVEIFTRVLRRFDVPPMDIEKVVVLLRYEGYEMLRLLYKEPLTLYDLKMSSHNLEVEAFTIDKKSEYVGKTLEESKFRKIYGLTVVMIKRKTLMITNLNAQTRIMAQDTLFFVGPKEGFKLLHKQVFKK